MFNLDTIKSTFVNIIIDTNTNIYDTNLLL